MMIKMANIIFVSSLLALRELLRPLYIEINSNQLLIFAERGKPEYPEKNLSAQSREPTNSTSTSFPGSFPASFSGSPNEQREPGNEVDSTHV